MTIKTAQQLKAIRQDIEAALKAVAEKHGLQTVKVGTMRHDADGFRTALEVQYQGGDTADMKALRLNAPFMGFNQEIAGATIQYGGKILKVTGMKRTKLVLEADGKTYTASIDDVKRVLQKQNSQYVSQ